MTLLFSGIVGFAQYCAANTDAEGAMKIVKMLNELYTIFDALCDTKRIPNIYKVSGINESDVDISRNMEWQWATKHVLSSFDTNKMILNFDKLNNFHFVTCNNDNNNNIMSS